MVRLAVLLRHFISLVLILHIYDLYTIYKTITTTTKSFLFFFSVNALCHLFLHLAEARHDTAVFGNTCNLAPQVKDQEAVIQNWSSWDPNRGPVLL
jgi:hypothetical protein